MPMATAFILPGLNNSGPDHWQSHWERLDPGCQRIEQDEWDAPRCADWVVRLDESIAQSPTPVVLVAHSSSCAMVAHWASTASRAHQANVLGALLVGPSDPDGAHYPPEPTGFSPVPMLPLPFPSIVVASTNDPYVAIDRARAFADAWQSRFVQLTNAGHINAASGHGAWPEGFALLSTLRSQST